MTKMGISKKTEKCYSPKLKEISYLVEKRICFKIALNRLLTPAGFSTRRALLESSGIIDFENKNISVVRKH